MPVEKIDTLVVGGGQAGIAMSEHLSVNGVPHLVLERNRVAERWRTARWDSLVTNGPAWHDRFPGLTFGDVDKSVGPDDFPLKDTVADYLVAYAKKIAAPVRCGVEVLKVDRKVGQRGFRIETSTGAIEAHRVVAATGAFQRPIVPAMVPAETGVLQMHSTAYRNPAQLPDGAVLIVGSGSSGTQIAEELLEAGRKVFLSVGPHERPPRAYRGRDYCWWLGVLGKWDAAAQEAGKEHVTIAVSGAHGGHTIDFRLLATKGITLLGRTEACSQRRHEVCAGPGRKPREGRREFALRAGRSRRLRRTKWSRIARRAGSASYRAGRGLREEPHPFARPRRCGHCDDHLGDRFHDRLQLAEGRHLRREGQAEASAWRLGRAGIYFLGLPWQSRRGSSFIWGVWHDAKYLADQITIQRNYIAYHEAASRRR